MTKFLIYNQYCYDYLINQIPTSLLLYGHLTMSIAAIIFSVFLFRNNKTLESINLTILLILLGLWSLLDLVAWFAFLGPGIVMFTWSLTYLIVPLMFFFSFYFLYVFFEKKDLTTSLKLVSTLIMVPMIIAVYVGGVVNYFDANICEAADNFWANNYYNFIEGFFLFAVIFLCIRKFRQNATGGFVSAGIGVLIFLLFFFLTDVAIRLLANFSAVEYVYNFSLYGFLGMPVLLGFLSFTIVRYKAFDIKLLATQALIWTLIILVGSQFFFIRNPINYVLNGVTFVGAIISGILIVRSVKRVDTQREELALANQEQETLVHFITHQIKGYFTKSRNILDTLTDMENVPEGAQRLIGEGLRSDREGVELVENILNAANLKTGKMQFKDEKGSLDQMVKKLVDELAPLATAKNLKLNLYCSTPVQFNADAFRLKDLFKNLITNSINYTFEGGITIYLNKKPDHVEFIIKDTGIGLTEDDKRKLFTSGGRGSESVKFNVSSTGYGLYIAKKVVDYYHGRIWAESEGRNKGTTFVVTLPLEK